MADLPSYYYLFTPEQIAEIEEGRSRAGCRFESRVELVDPVVIACEKGKNMGAAAAAISQSHDAPFVNADQALRWARRVSALPIIQLPSTYALSGRAPEGNKSGLSGFERHGQAAAVISVTHQALNDTELAYIAARYFGQVEAAMRYLVPYVIAGMGTGVYQTRAVQALIANCFPHSKDGASLRMSMHRLRSEARQAMNQVTDTQRGTRDRLRALHNIALDRLSLAFEEKHLIQPADAY